MAKQLYPTSDASLHKFILSVFAADKRTSSAHLRVGVLNGIVHLAGSASSPEVRLVAQQLAEAVVGVRGVVNRIDAPGAPRPARSVNLDIQD